MGKQSFAVIGMGRFGTSTAKTLADGGHEVLAVDREEERINQIKDFVLHAVVADTTDERAIAQLGVRNFDAVVVAIGNDLRASILTTVLCKEQGARCVVAKALDDLHAKLLLKTGADRVVQPEHDGGVRLGRSLPSDNIVDSLELTDDYSINEIRVPKEWVGRSLAHLAVRTRYGVSVIALRRGGTMIVNMDPLDALQEDDILFLVGDNEHLERITDA